MPGLLRPSLAGLLVFEALCTACSTPTETGRFARHGNSEVWASGLKQQIDCPSQWIPELSMFVATPALIRWDHRIARDSREDHPFTGGDTRNGDLVQLGLGAVAAGYAVGSAVGGDDARSIEVAAESSLATAGITQLLKVIAARPRPSHGASDSFPSGHASFCFGAATYLSRSLADEGSEWYWNLGYLSYLPAAFVGLNRIEGGRHFPADVTGGAFLGMFITNLVYNAHYGRGEDPAIFQRTQTDGWRLEPVIAEDQVGLALVFRF